MVKELKLIEKHLPRDGKYADATYNITWSDYASGGPITNQMLAGKLDFGVMGDYPLIVNGSKFQETKSLRTVYVSGTGYNLKGAGNAIVVPVKSNFYKLEDLKGKSISTPVGSAAWGMLIKALQDKKMPLAEHRPEESGARPWAPPTSPPARSTRTPISALVGNHGVPRHRPQDL